MKMALQRIIRMSGEILRMQRRGASYIASSLVKDKSEYTEVETCTNVDWKVVERLLPPRTVPVVSKKDSYPSGWVPPRSSAINLPFFVRRTRNHLPPVYLHVAFRGTRRLTVIRYAQGDLWALENDLRNFLSTKTHRSLGIQVHELACRVIVKGDHVANVLEWFYAHGF